jgi:hypothetical protein
MGLKFFSAKVGTIHLYLGGLKIFFLAIQNKINPGKFKYFEQIRY